MAVATATTGGGYAAGEQVPDDIFASLGAAQAKAAGEAPTPDVPLGGGFGQRGSQKPVEPAVVTSDTIANKVIPDNKAKLDAVSQKGTYIGQDGNMYHSDGSLVPAPVDAQYDAASGSWKSSTGTFGTAPQYVDNPTNDPEIAQTNTILASLKANSDSSTVSTINSIQRQYDQLIQQQNDMNSRATGARQQTLLLGGTSRYAPLAAAGVTLAQTSYGLQQVQKLEAQEDSAIATAKQAQQSNNMALMDKALATIDSVRTAKQAAAQKVADQLQTANQKLLEQRQQATQDEEIAKIYAGGVHDPAAILAAAKAAGLDTVTADHVAAVIKDLVPASVAGDVYKFTSVDTGKLLGAGLNSTSIKALSDYYNGRSSVAPALTEKQQTVVSSVLNGKTSVASATKPKVSGSYTYTPADLSKIQAWVSATKGTDGYVDPDAYKQAFDAWVNSGGIAKDFVANFPPKNYINPKNTDLPQYLKSKTNSSSSAGATAADINALFPPTQ